MVQTESESELDRGDVAPDFELPGADGETHALDDFETDALLVVFTCNRSQRPFRRTERPGLRR